MANKIIRGLKIFFTEPQWEKVRAVFWFFVITMVFHVLWRIWANSLHFAPVRHLVSSIQLILVNQVYDASAFLLRDILNVTLFTEPSVMITKNSIRLLFGESASGLKQICQFAILILLFRGSWKHKAWYIPVGMVILHLTNIFRIMSMVIIAMHWPQQIHYAHDNYLRILYYVVIFGLWLFWIEKISSWGRKTKTG